jgi:hypothetical protein
VRHDRRSVLAKAAAVGTAALTAAVPWRVAAAESGEPQTFPGGTDGSLLYRDSGIPEGARWLSSAAPGAVLASGALGQPPLWTDTPTLKSIVSTAVELVYPYSTVWAQHDPTINGVVGNDFGNVGGFKFGCLYQPVRFSNGWGGEPNYVDDTWHLGINVGTLYGGVGRADTSKPNVALSFESKFYGGSSFGQEFHVQGVSADGSTTFRPLSFFMAHDASWIIGTLAVDVFNVNDKLGNNMLQVSYVNQAVDLVGRTLRFTANNVPAVQQRASTGSYLNLLYLDGGNVANIAAPLYVVAPRAGAGAPMSGTFAVFQPTTAQSGDTGLLLQMPGVSGNLYGMRVSGAPSGSLTNVLCNDTMATGAHAVTAIQVSGAGGGDPYVRFEVPGSQDYSIGIRNSDSGTLTFSAGSSLGSAKLLALPASGGLRLPKLASGAAAPPSNNATIFMRDNGSGKMQFCVRFPTGAVQVIATEP